MEPLAFTLLEDGSVTIDNSPAPDSISIGRVLWESMVNGELAWATVTQDEDNTQHLALDTSNVTATFDRTGNGPGRSTILQTVTWSDV